MNYDRPILTFAQVRQWEDRAAEVARLLQELQEEAATLARKLEAAKVIVGNMAPDENISNGSGNQPALDLNERPASEVSVPQTILLAMKALGGVQTGRAIRGWIRENAPVASAKLDNSPSYVHTALKRHIQQKRVIREGAGYRLASSP